MHVVCELVISDIKLYIHISYHLSGCLKNTWNLRNHGKEDKNNRSHRQTSASESDTEMENHALATPMGKLDATGLDIREIKLDISGIQTDISDLKTISHVGDTAQKALDKTGEHDDNLLKLTVS